MSDAQSTPPPRPHGPLRRFFEAGHADHGAIHRTHPWYVVLWLTGVDYFSTLGYQPGIAFLACGALSPVATALLVLVTLFGALPTYREVASHSYVGQGSIAMLEHLLPGWAGKLLVLMLLGFASTDFIITITLSAADAAAHAAENPVLHGLLGEHRFVITLVLLLMLTLVFLAGFKEAMGLALVVGVPYILLSAAVIVRALVEVAQHPGAVDVWLSSDILRMEPAALLLASVLAFPRLALGMSGFETGVSVMPLVDRDVAAGERPETRIDGTRKLLTAAALMMSGLLVTSSIATTVLIPAQEFAPGGKANGRALAYLAHALLGDVLGTAYDVVTIAILWFAGASAMAGLLNLIPRYLPRFGMAPRWVSFPRPLILVIFAITCVVTTIFDADVDAQAGAYATGVLVLMLSAAVAVTLTKYREARAHGRNPLLQKRFYGAVYFALVAVVFCFTLVDNVLERPDGVIISAIFICGILVFSALSRWRRATELRVEKFTFVDQQSRELWDGLINKKVNLIPLEHEERKGRRKKLREWRENFKVEGPLAFLHVDLLPNRSEFVAPLRIKVRRSEDNATNYVIEVQGAVAIANTIAFISEQIDPISLFLTLTGRNPMTQAFRYLLWGEGETGVLVYQILVEHWDRTPEEDVKPMIFLMGE